MENLIPVINSLQEVFKETGCNELDLPQIIVVGSQSSGKSSVLESLVGESFLPRGSGIVTRCPIIIQLTPIQPSVEPNHTKELGRKKKSNASKDWYCTFDDNLVEKICDPNEVRKKIEELTEEFNEGKNKAISDKPIIVKVFSTKVIPLTVVDLPGIVKNPVGDQPENIEDLVYSLIKSKIQNKNSIILAVTPANTDIATSESIKFAAEVDPQKKRTLAVLTKLDLMDKGTDAKSALAGDIIPIKLGIIGVVNRSQADIDNNKSIEDTLEAEKKFLEANYPEQQHTNGCIYLRKRLNELLLLRIKETLPALKKKISSLLEIREKERDSLGTPIAVDEEQKKWYLDDRVHDFVEKFKTTIRDRSNNDTFTVVSGLPFAVKLAQINSDFTKKVRELGNLNGKMLESKIKIAIKHSTNIECFTSIENTFKALSREQIEHLGKLCLEVASNSHGVFLEIVDHCLDDKRLAKLNLAISRIMNDLLHDQLKLTQESIKTYIQIQSDMIYSMDPKFQDLMKISKFSSPDDNKDEDQAKHILRGGFVSVKNPTNFERDLQTASFPLGSYSDMERSVPYVRDLVITYCTAIQMQIGDYVPKHIMHYLHKLTVEKMKNLIRMGTSGQENELVSEPESVILKRKETLEMIKNLQKANGIIRTVEYCM